MDKECKMVVVSWLTFLTVLVTYNYLRYFVEPGLTTLGGYIFAILIASIVGMFYAKGE